jgi:hypothetical protein
MLHKRALLLGLSPGALLRGLRGGFSDFVAASIGAGYATRLAPGRLQRTLPVRALSEILGASKVEVRLDVQAEEDGKLPRDQALALLTVLVLARPRVVLEIGTFHGHTAKAMAMNLPEALIHTVDLPPDFDPAAGQGSLPKDDFHLIAQRKVGRAFQDTPLAKRIVQHFGDTATWDFNVAAGATFFFIDGSHTYEYCKNDSEKCLALGGGKGTFVWHDCDGGHPGVVRLLAEWRSQGRDVMRIENTPLAYWAAS